MPKHSAGILVFHRGKEEFELFLVHPGGPYWKNKDTHAWSIPKGEIEAGEEARKVAMREFREETGFDIESEDQLQELGQFKQKGGKEVHVWVMEGDFDPKQLESNTFTIEWPPKSGEKQEFPEVDKAAWIPLSKAKEKMHKGQAGIVDAFTDEIVADD